MEGKIILPNLRDLEKKTNPTSSNCVFFRYRATISKAAGTPFCEGTPLAKTKWGWDARFGSSINRNEVLGADKWLVFSSSLQSWGPKERSTKLCSLYTVELHQREYEAKSLQKIYGFR